MAGFRKFAADFSGSSTINQLFRLQNVFGEQHVRLEINVLFSVVLHSIFCFMCLIFTARRSYASAVLGVVILSVCPSVCLSHGCFVTKPNNAPGIYRYTTRKGNHSSFLTPMVGRRCPLPSEICAQSDPPPSKNADFDKFPLITSQP